jgi:hypothetical protein
MDMEEGLSALERLGSQDKESRSHAFEGRRLVRVDGGYIVLNFQVYRERDHTSADRSRRYRERLLKNGSTGNHEPKAQFVKPDQEQVKLLAAKMGLPSTEADKFWAYYESNGWRVGRNKMVDWHKALSGWKMRYEDNPGNNKAGGGFGKRAFDRNAGTFNAGTTEQYDTAKIQAARELREQQSREGKAPV